MYIRVIFGRYIDSMWIVFVNVRTIFGAIQHEPHFEFGRLFTRRKKVAFENSVGKLHNIELQ